MALAFSAPTLVLEPPNDQLTEAFITQVANVHHVLKAVAGKRGIVDEFLGEDDDK